MNHDGKVEERRGGGRGPRRGLESGRQRNEGDGGGQTAVSCTNSREQLHERQQSEKKLPITMIGARWLDLPAAATTRSGCAKAAAASSSQLRSDRHRCCRSPLQHRTRLLACHSLLPSPLCRYPSDARGFCLCAAWRTDGKSAESGSSCELS